ncbi:hypothetical protein SPD48_03820 [Pseudogracilibacillus sp. SE30717A]|uniref:hypothetical protein n=1 Tax=Pseudogracilibacillus sp. SE30717A TaxID=3098293 RepID=UPI00300DD8E5
MLIPNFQPQFETLNLENTVEDLKKYNFEIIFADEYFPFHKFFNMEALIYYVKVIEWEFPEFKVKDNFNELMKAYNELIRKGYVLNYEHRFIMVAINGELQK